MRSCWIFPDENEFSGDSLLTAASCPEAEALRFSARTIWESYFRAGPKLKNLIQGDAGRSTPRRQRLRRLLIQRLEDRRLLTTIDLAALVAGQGSTIFGAGANDQSGFSVSNAGDVNGDGFDDLLIGAPFADASGNSKTGFRF